MLRANATQRPPREPAKVQRLGHVVLQTTKATLVDALCHYLGRPGDSEVRLRVHMAVVALDINGAVFGGQTLLVRRGEGVELSFVNRSMMPHPNSAGVFWGESVVSADRG